jgi:hypothetical protein
MIGETTVRPYRESDLAALKGIFEHDGFAFDFPNLSDPIFVRRLVSENGTVRGGLVAKITAEMFLFLDKQVGTPEERMWSFLELHETMRDELTRLGLADANLWLPPQLEKSFGKRLMRLGWEKALWPAYVFDLDKAR